MKNIWQFIKFSLVGLSNTLISEGVYVIVVFWGGHYLIASLLGFLISVLNAYYWNSRYVFTQAENGERVWWKALAKTYAAYLGGYLLNVVLLVLWIDVVQISRFLEGPAGWCTAQGWERFDAQLLGEILAAGINLLITVPVNYVLNKYWAFRSEKVQMGGEG